MQQTATVHHTGIHLAFSARNLTIACSIITALILVAHATAYLLYFNIPHFEMAGSLVNRFGLDRDGNVPTLFSALLLFGAALLLFVVHLRAKAQAARYRQHWLVLCFVFLFLGLDEATQIHEFLSLVIKSITGNAARPGFLNHAWIIPYMLLLLGVVLYFFRFVLQLPPRIRNLFFLSGFLYVGSAMGLEMLEGIEETVNGKSSILVLWMQTLEETMEMVAIILFNHTLIQYLAQQQITITLGTTSVTDPAS